MHVRMGTSPFKFNFIYSLLIINDNTITILVYFNFFPVLSRTEHDNSCRLASVGVKHWRIRLIAFVYTYPVVNTQQHTVSELKTAI